MLEQSEITFAEHYKRTADSVHYKSENVQMFLKIVGSRAEQGCYWMPRHNTELPLTISENLYLQSQGFSITSETISWQ